MAVDAAAHPGLVRRYRLSRRERGAPQVHPPPTRRHRAHYHPRDGLVRIVLKKPFSDGTVAIDLDPLSPLCRLAATVPPPRFHTVRYAGVLSSHAKSRPRAQARAGRTRRRHAPTLYVNPLSIRLRAAHRPPPGPFRLIG